MDSIRYCRDKGAPPGSRAHYTLLTLDPPQRRALTALKALVAELQEIPWIQDPGVARAKLDWWRHELQRLVAGSPQHPVTQVLGQSGPWVASSEALFVGLCDGVAMDLDYDVYPTLGALTGYLHRLGSNGALLTAKALGYQSPPAAAFAHEMGAMELLAERLGDVYRHALRGRYYIPEEDMNQFDLQPHELRRPRGDDRTRALFHHQGERIRAYHRRALEQLPAEDRYGLRPLLINGRLTEAWLDEVAADGYRLLERGIALTPLRQLWLAWHTAWREGRNHRRRPRRPAV
ncbi:MAG: squalene/phytoene synthase family protein [Candidatus Competibacterales bacterium]